MVVLGALPRVSNLAASEPQLNNELSKRIDRFLAASDLSAGKVGIVFRDGESGRILYARNAGVPLKPASNMKLLTTAAALHYLGGDYRYRTIVAARGKQTGEKLAGDLVVIGSGDPSISGRFVEGRDRTAIFQRWAEVLKQRNIRRIEGNLVGNDDAFDDTATAPGWPASDRGEWYCAEISALAYNDNCIDLRWQGGGSGEDAARFELLPPTGYVRVINRVNTAGSRGAYDRYYERNSGSNVITARGWVARNDEEFDSAAISNPTLYFVTVLADVLRESGIDLVGEPRDLDEYDDKSAFADLTPIIEHESPPLEDLVIVVNRNSHNFYAEQVLKTLGRVVEGEGSFEAGGRAVRRYVERLGIETTGMNPVDGSGLSRDNRLTVDQIAAVLLAVGRTEYGDYFRTTLPIGGRTGSLKSRFGSDQSLREIGPRVRAKTGYIRGCHALSGWLESRAGQDICFSVICNDLPMTGPQTKVFLERLVALAVDLRENV